MKIVFVTNLNTFGSKVPLSLKIMDFENVPLTKVIHVYVIEGMNAKYTFNKIIFLVKMYLYLKCSVKRGDLKYKF